MKFAGVVIRERTQKNLVNVTEMSGATVTERPKTVAKFLKWVKLPNLTTYAASNQRTDAG
jgi:hypothetical protein